MRFIDLFSGLGGFHVALRKLNHECVFACEIDEELRNLYYSNFGILPVGDIKKINEKNIPEHDILCAGFPCQPFSKAGNRNGLDDENRGDLIFDIARIVEYHKPSYIILENVPHIKSHDNEKTWNKIQTLFGKKLGYNLKEQILSPHNFNIPQIRKRVFIIGSPKNIDYFIWPEIEKRKVSLKDFLSTNKSKIYKKISSDQINCLKTWQEFINFFPTTVKIPGFPIWSTEFGANYPYKKITPYNNVISNLKKYKGSFGSSLNKKVKKDILEQIPKYSRINEKRFPEWKIRYIRENRKLYSKYCKKLKKLIPKLNQYPFSWQKFEWNCGDVTRDIFKYVIQFRASGIRVRLDDSVPSLVLSPTQIPIIGWKKRYITKYEARKLQSLGRIKLPQNDKLAFKALGNAVNAKIVLLIARKLINVKESNREKSKNIIRKSLMQRFKSKNTLPERMIANELKKYKLKFIQNDSNLYGNPDFVLKKNNLIIFVDSDFWHGHPKNFRMPKTNLVYWKNKIQRNIKRDKIVTYQLRKQGWIVLRFWESDIKNNINKVVFKIIKQTNND